MKCLNEPTPTISSQPLEKEGFILPKKGKLLPINTDDTFENTLTVAEGQSCFPGEVKIPMQALLSSLSLSHVLTKARTVSFDTAVSFGLISSHILVASFICRDK